MNEVRDSTPSTASISLVRLRWIWVGLGVAVGAVLLSTLVPIVEHEAPRPDVAILIGALTFVLTGILVGYQSPGRTEPEAAIAGAILGGLTLLMLRVAFDVSLSATRLGGGLVLGSALAVVGGWVGEVLQGTLRTAGPTSGLQWPWIVVGTVLGLMLNCYAVFVVHALFDLSSLGVLVSFLASFVVAGFFVGYFSPGITILEPAVAALLMVAGDMLLSVVGFRAPFPMVAVALGMVAGFVLALAGGYGGEVFSHLRHRKAWGDDERGAYRRVPKPGG